MVHSWTEQPSAWGVWFSTALSTRLPEHQHEGTEINLLMVGHVRYRVGNRVLVGSAGQVLVLPAGVPHDLIAVSDDAALWVVESGVVLPEMETLGARALMPAVHLRCAAQRLLRQLWLRPPSDRVQQLQRLLRKHLVEISFEQPQVVPAKAQVHPAVVRARAACENLKGVEGDIQALAQTAGISPSRLAHLFSDQIGLTPLQYRNFARVQNLIRTFESGETNLLRAALSAGFGSYPQFHRVFRQVCGASPSQHMKFLERDAVVDPQITLSCSRPALQAAGPPAP